jgi:hypothetical protein
MKPSLLSIVIFVGSATLSAQEVGGRYVLENIMEIVSELLLLPNHSFSYVLSSGDADYYANGTWAVDGDSVVLNSAGVAMPPFRFVSSEAVKTPDIHVFIKSTSGEPVKDIDVLLERAQGTPVRAQSDNKGEVVFAGPGAPRSATLTLRAYGSQGGPFKLNPEHDTFFFEVNWEAVTRVPFRNERLKIDGRRLEMRFWNTKAPLNYTRS